MLELTDKQTEQLAAAITDPATVKRAHDLKPDDADADWQPGVFELAWSVRQALPPGLAAGDFDGDNIAAILTAADASQ